MNELSNSDESASTPQLIRELAVDIKDVGLGELEAAKLEIKEELGQLKTAMALIAGAGTVGLIGLVLLALAAVRGVQLWLTVDLGFALLIVAGALFVAAALIYFFFQQQSDDIDVVPERAAAHAAKDAKWIKQQVKSVAK